jgi:hypothetical protein
MRKFGCGLYGARVGRPRRKNGPFLVKGQIRIVEDFRTMTEGVRRMQQFVEIEVSICSVVHILSPLRQFFAFRSYLTWMVRGGEGAAELARAGGGAGNRLITHGQGYVAQRFAPADALAPLRRS